jgi:hypothetical protein
MAGEEVERALGRVGTETHLEDPFWHICTTLDIYRLRTRK